MKFASSEHSGGARLAHGLAALALTALAGSLWVVGYMVAPTLFAMLERERAGEVAGQLFTWVAWVVMGATVLLLALERLFLRQAPAWVRWCLWAMLVLAIVGHFGMRPYIADLKAAHATAQLATEAYRTAFGRAHGASALLFLVQSILAAALVTGWRR